jgi:hypothetical protein
MKRTASPFFPPQNFKVEDQRSVKLSTEKSKRKINETENLCLENIINIDNI